MALGTHTLGMSLTRMPMHINIRFLLLCLSRWFDFDSEKHSILTPFMIKLFSRLKLSNLRSTEVEGNAILQLGKTLPHRQTSLQPLRDLIKATAVDILAE